MKKNTTICDTIDLEMQPRQTTIEFLQNFSRIVYARKLDGIDFVMVFN